MQMYEVIYQVQGDRRWTNIRAKGPLEAIEALEAKYEGNEVAIVHMQKSFAVDPDSLL